MMTAVPIAIQTFAAARRATRLTFFLSGMAMASWAPMVPFAKARLERFDDQTHFGPMEEPEAIAASILAHLGPV